MVSASTVVIMLDGVPVQQYTAQPAVRSDYRLLLSLQFIFSYFMGGKGNYSVAVNPAPVFSQV